MRFNDELDFLLERESAPAGTVTLLGVEYELRNVNMVQDFLVVLGAAEQFVVFHEENAEPIPSNERVAAGQLAKLRDEAHRCIRMLVPEMPLQILQENFATPDKAQKLFWHLQALAKGRATDALKKNSSGASGPMPRSTTPACQPDSSGAAPAVACIQTIPAQPRETGESS